MAAAQVGVEVRRAFWVTAARTDPSHALLNLAGSVPARGLRWASASLLQSLPVPTVLRHPGSSGAILTNMKVNWTFQLTHLTGATGAEAWELAREYPEMASNFYHWILRIPLDELIKGSPQILGQLGLTSHRATTACLQALLDAKVPLKKFCRICRQPAAPLTHSPHERSPTGHVGRPKPGRKAGASCLPPRMC